MTEQCKALLEVYTKEHCEALLIEEPAGVDRILALLVPKRRRKQR